MQDVSTAIHVLEPHLEQNAGAGNGVAHVARGASPLPCNVGTGPWCAVQDANERADALDELSGGGHDRPPYSTPVTGSLSAWGMDCQT